MAPAVKVGAVIHMEEAAKLMQQLQHQLADLRPVFHKIDAELSGFFREQFATRGAAGGTPWEPLAPVTPLVRINRRMFSAAARKLAIGNAGADTPLRDTGGLWASFTKPGSPGSVRVIEPQHYERGSQYTVGGAPIADLVQSGFTSRTMPVLSKRGDVRFIRRKVPKKVPARPIIPSEMPAPVIKTWEGYIVNYLEAGAI